MLILKLLEAPEQTQWSPGSNFAVAPNGPQVLGRGPKSDLKFDHPSVSVDHAQFINKDKAWFVEDLGSRDGTRINGRRLQARSPSFCEQRMLGDGDRLSIGDFVFEANVKMDRAQICDPRLAPAPLTSEPQEDEDDQVTLHEDARTFAPPPTAPKAKSLNATEPQDGPSSTDGHADKLVSEFENLDASAPADPAQAQPSEKPSAELAQAQSPPQPPLESDILDPDDLEVTENDPNDDPDDDPGPEKRSPAIDPFLNDPTATPVVAEPAHQMNQDPASFVFDLDRTDLGVATDVFATDRDSYPDPYDEPFNELEPDDESSSVPVDGDPAGPNEVTLTSDPSEPSPTDSVLAERQALVVKLRDQLTKAELPDALWKIIDGHLDHLQSIGRTDPNSSQLIEYLECLASLPWNNSSRGLPDLEQAKRVLDRNHFGLSNVKRRLIEYIAGRKLNPTGDGPMLCLIGPVGVGKTSLAASIAKALGREHVIINCAELTDDSVIRGRRRPETGAGPGIIIDQLRRIGVNNPVIILDQIDKLSAAGVPGAPSTPSASMTGLVRDLIDPAKNRSFLDHYLDVSFDLSGAIFIATGDLLEPVPSAIRQLMETVDIPAYTENDKVQIARRYLIPRRMRANGLKAKDCKWFNTAIRRIISGYTREAGVKELQRQVEVICRRLAARTAAKRGRAKLAVIRPERISHWLGPVKYTPNVGTKPPGVVATASNTRAGGDILYVEATAYPGQSQINLTGHPSTVMRETAQGVLSLLKSGAKTYHFDSAKMSNLEVHLHVPAEALPDDAPSAGLAMYICLISVLLETPVKPNLAICGEISLGGRILPVGSVHEKAVAAVRDGIKTMILPRANQADVQQLDVDIQRRLKFLFVEDTAQVVEHALGKRSVQQAIKENLARQADAAPPIPSQPQPHAEQTATFDPGSKTTESFEADSVLPPDKSPDMFYEAALKFIEDEVPIDQSPYSETDATLADQILDRDVGLDAINPIPQQVIEPESQAATEDLGWWAEVTDAEAEPEAEPAEPAPIKRRFFNVATLLALLLGLPLGGMWVRSYSMQDELLWSSQLRHRQIISNFGCLTYTWSNQPVESRFYWDKRPIPKGHGLKILPRFLLFAKAGSSYHWTFTVPYWLIVVPFLIIPLMRAAFYFRQGRRRRGKLKAPLPPEAV